MVKGAPMVNLRTCTPLIAGHMFDLLTGRCIQEKVTSSQHPGGICGALRWRVHEATVAHVNDQAPDYQYACVTPLNDTELGQIQADKKALEEEKQRAYDAVALSVGGR
jgi:hypothetical protein